jgi:tetrahydromethanopterin S-methyltransferase subunit G
MKKKCVGRVLSSDEKNKSVEERLKKIQKKLKEVKKGSKKQEDQIND